MTTAKLSTARMMTTMQNSKYESGSINNVHILGSILSKSRSSLNVRYLNFTLTSTSMYVWYRLRWPKFFWFLRSGWIEGSRRGLSVGFNFFMFIGDVPGR